MTEVVLFIYLLGVIVSMIKGNYIKFYTNHVVKHKVK